MVSMSEKNENLSVGRRSLLGAAAAAVSAGAMGSRAALAQTKAETSKGEQNHSASNPGPINRALAGANPSSDQPPITDRGVIVPIWYSFDLTHRRIQDGGWTRQVTQRELPSSQDLAGVTMRLTAGNLSGVPPHTAHQRAPHLFWNSPVGIFQPDRNIFF